MSPRPAFHPWTKSETSPGSYSRSLATPEFMLSMLNEYALGHNCPYLGVTVSVHPSESSAAGFSVQDLQSRAAQALVHTRWVHPAVACQIKDSKQMIYKVQDAKEVDEWAARTVQTVQSEGGWLKLHDNISRNVLLPSKDGDCAFLYVIVSPEEASKARVSRFDLLLHVHHGLADGAGLRSMMNEILIGFAKPAPSSSYAWGEEADRLAPAALDVAVISDEVFKSLQQMPKEIPLPPLEKTTADSTRQGTGVLTHTFQSTGFLDRLLAVAREHDVKLTAVVQAALALAVYDEIKPTSEETCTVLSGFDLRTRNVTEPWNQRNKFVGAAVGLEMMTIPVGTLAETPTGESTAERFWAASRHMQQLWVAAAQRKDVAAANELRRAATGFIIKGVLDSIKAPSSGLSLNLNYVSDPAGSNQLDGKYETGDADLVLDRYQLVTEESTNKLSCRSHSWNNELCLCISFNKDRYQSAEVQRIMDKWVQTIEQLC